MATVWSTLGLQELDQSQHNAKTSVTSLTTRHLLHRLVVVGRHMSGKRTFVEALLSAAYSQNGLPKSMPHQQQSSASGSSAPSGSGSSSNVNSNKGSSQWANISLEALSRRLMGHSVGVGYTYVPLKAVAADITSGGGEGDGSLPQVNILTGFEVFVCDNPAGLRVAIPSLRAAERSVVVFVADLSSPTTVDETIATWSAHINEHLLQLCPQKSSAEETLNIMRRKRREHIDETRRALEEKPPSPEGAASASDGDHVDDIGSIVNTLRSALRRENSAQDNEQLPHGTLTSNVASPLHLVCPMASVIVGSRIDLLDKNGREQADGKSSGGPTTSNYALSSAKLTAAQYVVQLLRKSALMQGSACVIINSTATPLPHLRVLLSFFEQLLRTPSPSSDGSDGMSVDSSQVIAYHHQVLRDMVASSIGTAPTVGGLLSTSVSSAGGTTMSSAQQGLQILPLALDSFAQLNPFVVADKLVPVRTLFASEETESPTTGTAPDGSHSRVYQFADLINEVTTRESDMWAFAS